MITVSETVERISRDAQRLTRYQLAFVVLGYILVWLTTVVSYIRELRDIWLLIGSIVPLLGTLFLFVYVRRRSNANAGPLSEKQLGGYFEPKRPVGIANSLAYGSWIYVGLLFYMGLIGVHFLLAVIAGWNHNRVPPALIAVTVFAGLFYMLTFFIECQTRTYFREAAVFLKMEQGGGPDHVSVRAPVMEGIVNAHAPATTTTGYTRVGAEL